MARQLGCALRVQQHGRRGVLLLEAACLRVRVRLVRGLPALGAVFKVAAVWGSRLGGEVGVGLFLMLGFLVLLLVLLGLGLVAEEAEGVVGEVEAAEDEDCEGDLEVGLVGVGSGWVGRKEGTVYLRDSNTCLRLMWWMRSLIWGTAREMNLP